MQRRKKQLELRATDLTVTFIYVAIKKINATKNFNAGAIIADTSLTIASFLWWCNLCTQGSTMAILSRSGFWLISRGTSSLFLMPRLVWFIDCVVMTTSRTPLQHCVGCVCVDFNTAVTAFRVLHGLAPPYLNQLTRVADLPGRCRLRSSSSQLLQDPQFRRSTVGRRSFPVAASVLWLDIQSSPHYLFSVNSSKHIFP